LGLLIYNAGSGSAAAHSPDDLLQALRFRGAEVRLHECTEGEDLQKIAADAVAAGEPWIAAAGGDGTVEAVAKALLGTATTLGVIPCGTYNNFALSAGIPADPIEACHLIAAGPTRTVDVGLVNGEPFFECVGVGLDAALFPLGEEIKSGAVGKTWDLFRRASAYPLHRFEIEIDRPFGEALVSTAKNRSQRRLESAFRSIRHRRLRVRALMITVSNAPYYGMNFTVAPDARLDDGLLTIAIFKRYSKFQLWWHYFSIRAGRKVYSPRLITLRAKHVRISYRRRLHVHADGCPFEGWPVEISIRHAALRVFTESATPRPMADDKSPAGH
jgi:diacylglycerol kinase (ATP)